VIAANKSEGRAGDAGLYEAFSLGFGEPIAISAEHGEGSPICSSSSSLIWSGTRSTRRKQAEEERSLKLAIVGRPNAGKSTLINRILQQDRLITGPEAGITRDSIAIDWEWQGRPVRLIDTAGMRKKAKVDDKLEKLSVADARRAVDFAEVVVLLLDATRGLKRKTCASPITCCRKAARSSSRSANGMWRRVAAACSTASARRSRKG
jgi:GTP-binding protein